MPSPRLRSLLNAAARRHRALAPLTAFALVGVLAAFVVAVGPARSAGPLNDAGPTLAKEDTMRTDVSTVLVKAPRVTLEEILDRVARGEARRDSLLRDQSFTATLRVMRDTEGKKAPVLFAESVSKVYKKKPDKLRTVELRHYEERPDKGDHGDDEDLNADFSPSMGEEMVNFAFRPANRKNFKFTIEDRKLLGHHLHYTLGIVPCSPLAVFAPSGRVWVDTKDYLIERQQIVFRQSPVPLVLKDIKHLFV